MARDQPLKTPSRVPKTKKYYKDLKEKQKKALTRSIDMGDREEDSHGCKPHSIRNN